MHCSWVRCWLLTVCWAAWVGWGKQTPTNSLGAHVVVISPHTQPAPASCCMEGSVLLPSQFESPNGPHLAGPWRSGHPAAALMLLQAPMAQHRCDAA